MRRRVSRSDATRSALGAVIIAALVVAHGWWSDHVPPVYAKRCEVDQASSALLSLALGLNSGTGYQATVVCKP